MRLGEYCTSTTGDDADVCGGNADNGGRHTAAETGGIPTAAASDHLKVLVGRLANFLITLAVISLLWLLNALLALKKISSGAAFTSIPFRTCPRAAAATFILFKLGPVGRVGSTRLLEGLSLADSPPWPPGGRGKASLSGFGNWSLGLGINHSGRELSGLPQRSIILSIGIFCLYFLIFVYSY